MLAVTQIEPDILVINDIKHFVQDDQIDFNFFPISQDQLFIFWLSSHRCLYVVDQNTIS